jgi:predicted 2-oxoglutarate/Fe(II)-dependent dioxygenase YbiX
MREINKSDDITMKKNTPNKIKDYIMLCKNVITHDDCDFIVNEYKDSTEWTRGKILDQTEQDENGGRNVFNIEISIKETITKNQTNRMKIDAILFNSVSKILREYSKKFYVEFTRDSGYDLLKYDTGQYYKEHIDFHSSVPRTLSCSLLINDGYTGGDFSFFDNTLKMSVAKGSAIIFPSNFMYPHQILPVTSGVRYSVVTWIV